jgi:hypothetical protein
MHCTNVSKKGNLLSNYYHKTSAITAFLFAISSVSSSRAQDKTALSEKTQSPASSAAVTEPDSTSEPSLLQSADRFFNGKIPDALAKGKFSLNVRPRWEHAHQTGLTESDAFTIRTRFGYTTAPFAGFQAMIEGENVAVIGPSGNYNAAGSNPSGAGRTSIADPPTTELNQAWLSYTNWNTLLKGGRQRFTLDNHRFIGESGWRQNIQTYDSALIENKSLPYSALLYSYIWRVNRVYGDVDNLPLANTDFRSQSHIFHYNYNHWKWLNITAYTYLLDLDNDVPSELNSTATYGGFVNGTIPVHETVDLDYRAEFAWQTDYANNISDYGAEYYNVELGSTFKKKMNVGAGYEVLGSDNGQGVKTPLATLHQFNGWADVFLNTPGTGLRDLYAFAGITLPYEIPLRVAVHEFRSDTGGIHYGDEYDAVISRKFGKYWTALAKYAYFDGKNAPTAFNVDKFWLQLEFNY